MFRYFGGLLADAYLARRRITLTPFESRDTFILSYFFFSKRKKGIPIFLSLTRELLVVAAVGGGGVIFKQNEHFCRHLIFLTCACKSWLNASPADKITRCVGNLPLVSFIC